MSISLPSFAQTAQRMIANGKAQYFLLWSAGLGGSLNMSNRGFLSFNSNNQQTSYYTESYNGCTWAPGEGDVSTRQYYESYTLGVAQQSHTDCSIRLSPVPASSALHLSLQWNQSSELHLSITDAVGHVQSQLAIGVAGNNHYEQQLSVESWPAGVYFLRITDGQRTTNQTFSIVR